MTAALTAVLLGAASEAMADSREFENYDAMGLASGKAVKTDCTIANEFKGYTYCFGDEVARTEFMRNPSGFREKAKAFYSNMH